MSENLHSGHRKRMRNKCLSDNMESFTDHELIEMLLYYCIPMKDTNELAHKIIDECGNLAILMETKPQDLMNRCGISEGTAVFFAITSEIMKRCDRQKWEKKRTLSSAEEAGKFAVSLLSYEIYECFYVICLDSQSRIINFVKLSQGNIDEININIREIAETAIRYKATSVILAHNHPGGSLIPSYQDIDATSRISSCLNLMDIEVYDHIIVADNKYYSMAANKLVPSKTRRNKDG